MTGYSRPLMRRSSALAGIAGLIAFAVFLLLWLDEDERSDVGTLNRIRETGRIRIGFANEIPYGYLTAEGELTGESPEIAKVILERLGVAAVEAVLTEFGALVPGLNAGRFDLIAAGMYVTPERCREIAFSEPTYVIGSSFIVAEDNPKRLHGFEDVARNPDATLGVTGGAVERSYALAVGLPNDRLVIFPDVVSGLAGVQSGRVDAFAATSATTRYLLDRDSRGVSEADPFFDPVIDGVPQRGHGAFGFRKEDRELMASFNRELAGFIGSEAHLTLIERFGFTRENLPQKTTETLCTGG